jgi:hypothetical protein
VIARVDPASCRDVENRYMARLARLEGLEDWRSRRDWRLSMREIGLKYGRVKLLSDGGDECNERNKGNGGTIG